MKITLKLLRLFTLTFMSLFIVNNDTYAQQGLSCNEPIIVTSVPFTASGLTTCGNSNNFDSNELNSCGTSSTLTSYMEGQDLVLEFIPTLSGCYGIQGYNFNPTSLNGAGIFVFEGCPENGTAVCVGSDASILAYPLVDLAANTTYYIVISSQIQGLDDCVTFDVFITDPSSAPINDICENALELSGNGSNVNATSCTEPNEWTPDNGVVGSTICSGSGSSWASNQNGVWYTFSNDAVQDVTITIANIDCSGPIGLNTLQLGVWTNTGTCDLSAESLVGCLVTTETADIVLPNLAVGNYYLFADGTSGSLCTWTFESQEIIEDCSGLTATISGGGIICNPGQETSPLTINLTGTAPWEVTLALDGTNQNPIPNITSSPFTFDASESGTYTIANVTDATCTATGTGNATVIVSGEEPLSVSYAQAVFCSTAENILPITNASGGTFTADNGLIINTQTGEIDATTANFGEAHNITYTTTGDCPETATTTVTIHEIAFTNVLTELTLEQGEAVDFQATATSTAGETITYTISPTDSIPVDKANYTITATDEIGCSITAIASVTVNEPAPEPEPVANEFAIPTAFSPNDDGINDQFKIITKRPLIGELHIYNRWGQEVFTTNDLSKGWDGFYKSRPAAMGTYIYYGYIDLTEERIQFKGNVLLVR